MDRPLVDFNTYLRHEDVSGWDKLCREYGKIRTYKKGEEFCTCGHLSRYIGLIKEGSVKYVVYNSSDGEERVIGLETVGGFAASFPYSLRGRPSIFSVVINSDSEIYCVSVRKIIELSRHDEEVRHIIMQSLEAVFYTLYERYTELYTLSPKERYERLLKRCPGLFETFHLKDIASYLNVTRQHLSRLRRG